MIVIDYPEVTNGSGETAGPPATAYHSQSIHNKSQGAPVPPLRSHNLNAFHSQNTYSSGVTAGPSNHRIPRAPSRFGGDSTPGAGGDSTNFHPNHNCSNSYSVVNSNGHYTRALISPTMDSGGHNLRFTAGVNIIYEDNNPNHFVNVRPDLYQKCNRGSHSSDTSSAYSGSDTMTSIHSSTIDPDEVDLSGLVESVVDSDEEDLAESMDSLNIRDTVRECLEKDPSDRNEDDIETLLEFTQKLKAFTSLTLTVRRALCSVMVFAVVEKAGTVVMNDGEELDSWSVLINGHVEIEHTNGEHQHREELQVGDSFGILPTMDKLFHQGVMRTKCDDCQFVCITQNDYYRILHQGEENTRRHEDAGGNLVMVTELRDVDNSRRGHVVIRGTPDRLMLQLIEENSVIDPTYVEDFLLTYRTFIANPNQIAQQLLTWFENEDAPLTVTATAQEIQDRVSRVVLLWVNNHFTDFETDSGMIEFLETFIRGLVKKKMTDQLRLLHIASSSKARVRNVTLTRSSRDEDLHFMIKGGYEKASHQGIFITHVDKRSKADTVGLKRGDQILEVNGQSFEHVALSRALEIIKGTTHLSITVKSNLFAFRDMLNPEEATGVTTTVIANSRLKSQRKKLNTLSSLSSAELMGFTTNASGGDGTGMASKDQTDCANFVVPTAPPLTPTGMKEGLSGFMTLAPKRRFKKALYKMNLLPKNMMAGVDVTGQSQDDHGTPLMTSSTTSIPQTTSSGQPVTGCTTSGVATGHVMDVNSSVSNASTTASSSSLYHSQSNPDLSQFAQDEVGRPDFPEHVLKVYKADQTCKYLLIHKETTAHEVVMLALQEFGIHDPSSKFSLCEVSVGEGGMVKQRRLPDQLQNLAERIGLSARYYLKTNGVSETLVPDEMAIELTREAIVHFLHLNANELAIQLTFQDFAIFRQIESTEYVDELFEIKASAYGVVMLQKFAELVNREMFWVVTEVCSEANIVRRMKIVKKFIKIARFCKDCRNFNSMFAIISGLSHSAVSRLRNTWEKVPTKYHKLFNDLQELMDPSRNMSKYRQLVAAELLGQHPIVPFYPIVKKDLTFIHLGNETRVEALINFEKLRMISKEVRTLTQMCSSTYDFVTMLELRGQPPSSAMLALNQMSILQSIVGPTASNHLLSANTVKRRKKSAATPNPKKMFEEAQMVRRVKAFLNNMKVIADEEQLHSLSVECEPNTNSAPNSVTVRKRHPSPTLSTTSSTSSNSESRKNVAKFGAALLALSESSKIRPHQPKFPGFHPLQGNSPNPSPNSNRRTHQSSLSSVGLSGSGSSMAAHASFGPPVRPIHERSHSDTSSPLPSVDLSVESSSVTSLSNLAMRKAGSLTSTDSGHGSCSASSHLPSDSIQGSAAAAAAAAVAGTGAALTSSSSTSSCNVYHVTSSIIHNSLPPPQQQQQQLIMANANTIQLPPMVGLNQRRHSALAGTSFTGSGPVVIKTGLPLPATAAAHHSHPHAAAQPSPPPLPPQLAHHQQSHHGHGESVIGSPHLAHYSAPAVGNNQTVVVGAAAAAVATAVASGHVPGVAQPPPIISRHNPGLSRSGGPRMPPAYNVAAQMARYQHRMGRAHSHEGVVSPPNAAGNKSSNNYYHAAAAVAAAAEPDEDEDEDTQVSAV